MRIFLFVMFILVSNRVFAQDCESCSIPLFFDANTTLEKVGELKLENNNVVKIQYYFRTYGQVGATQRLLFFCNERYIGRYDVPSKPTLEKGGVLDFHVPKEFTGIVEIKSCDLPEKLWLDGEIYDLLKAK